MLKTGYRTSYLFSDRSFCHEVGEDTGVGGEAGEGDAVVGVDGDDLLLV